LNKNVGEWDWDALANYFDVGELTEWGFTDDELTGCFTPNFEPSKLENQGNLDDVNIVKCPECGNEFAT